MKKTIIFMITILAFMIQNINLKSQDNCYDANGCGSIPWTSVWMGIVYPDFPTCTLTVEVKTRVCNNQTQVKIGGIHFYDPFSKRVTNN
jgi:hypothetical protein